MSNTILDCQNDINVVFTDISEVQRLSRDLSDKLHRYRKPLLIRSRECLVLVSFPLRLGQDLGRSPSQTPVCCTSLQFLQNKTSQILTTN